MKTRNKSRTAGVLIPPGVKSSGSFSPNGFGTCASPWAMHSVPHPCVRPNSRRLAPSLWQNQTVQPRQLFPTSRRSGRYRGWDVSRVSTLRLNQTVPYSVLLVSPCILRNAVLNVMAVCVWSMPPACVADNFYKLHPEGTGTHCRFLLVASLRREALTWTRSGEGSIQKEGKEGHWPRYCCRRQRQPILK